jgi:hypothetical protein
MDMQTMGRLVVLVGVVIVVAGLVLIFFDRIPFLGKLPGDISIKRENFQLHIPLTSSVLISLIVTFLLWLISNFRGR